jgi:hypothetical protein
MKVKNESNNISKDTDNNLDADSKFHILFGWLAAMSVSIASAALAIVS